MDVLTPADVANLIGASVASVRRWSSAHAEHLSAGANPPAGMPRTYTRKDVEVLRAVSDLRNQGFSSEAINVRLGDLTVATVEDADEEPAEIPPGPIESSQAGQEGRSAELMPPSMVQMLSSLLDAQQRATDQRIDALERGQRDRVMMLLYGVLIGVVGAVVLFWLAFVLARMAG